uniref:Genome polyprotein n=1 Tax=Miniopterus bat picornavirus TaxID=3141889 RepID=A0AAU7E2Y8_9VIRU
MDNLMKTTPPPTPIYKEEKISELSKLCLHDTNDSSDEVDTQNTNSSTYAIYSDREGALIGFMTIEEGQPPHKDHFFTVMDTEKNTSIASGQFFDVIFPEEEGRTPDDFTPKELDGIKRQAFKKKLNKITMRFSRGKWRLFCSIVRNHERFQVEQKHANIIDVCMLHEDVALELARDVQRLKPQQRKRRAESGNTREQLIALTGYDIDDPEQATQLKNLVKVQQQPDRYFKPIPDYPFRKPNYTYYEKKRAEWWDAHPEAAWQAAQDWQKMRQNPCKPRPKAEAGINQQDVVIQNENTVFTDQRETVTDEAYITAQQQPDLKNMSMPEEEWHVRNIMAKPLPFWSGDWSTGDPLGKIIKQWTIPGDVFFGQHYNQVATFTFFRGHPRIRFQLNGTKFHAGRLMVAFIPAYSFAEYDDKLYSVSNLTSLPHVILDASIANSGELNLPFIHMNSYFNSAAETRTWQSLGRLVLVVFNKLRAATTSSQTIGLTGWISFDNCELHQPCFAHDVNLPKGSGTAKAESGLEGLVKSALPTVLDIAAPELGVVGDVLGGAANMDKPTDPIEIQRWVPNAVTGLSTGDGIDRASRLCLTPGSYTVPDAEIISTTNDDMNLLELCKIPVRIELFDWSSGMTTGTRKAHIPVCPNLFTGYATNEKVTPAVEVITPTLISYISRYFKYWRGGLRYKIQVVASQMHTGRLMVSYGAGINIQDPSPFNKAATLNTYVIDLQEKHEVEFVVPFFAERPWLRCDRFRKYDEDGKDDTQDNYEQVGFLDIFILNRLSHPDAVSSSVAVNVFISAADDFELAFPSDLAGFQGIGNPIEPPSKRLAPKAESLTTEETVSSRTDESTLTLGKGSGKLGPAAAITMGENAMDLKKLLRRYTKAYSVRTGSVVSETTYMAFVNTPDLSGVCAKFAGTEGVQCRTALSHFSQLFTFWRGSLRYKLVFSTISDEAQGGVTIRVFHIPGVFTYGKFSLNQLDQEGRAMMAAFESQGTIAATTGIQGSLEFEIPFYTPYTQLRTFTSGGYGALDATGLVFIVIDAANKGLNQKCVFDLYQSGGDDFTLNYLRAAPRIQFTKDYDTNRVMSDNAPFIFNTNTPPPLKQAVLLAPQKEKPKAEALLDYVPGVTSVKTTVANLNQSAAKVESVCDTANHILQQASKKLGMSSNAEDEDETTTIFEDIADVTKSLGSPIMTVVEGLMNYINMAPTKIAEYLKPQITAADILADVANLVSGLTAFHYSTNIIQKICAVVTIVSTLLKDVSVAIKNQLYHFTTSVFTTINGCKQGNQQPKAETAGLDLVAPLSATLAVAMGMIGFKKIPTDRETIDLCKAISEKLKLFNFSSTALSNIKNLWKEISELVQWCIDWVMNLIAPQMLAQLKLQREFDDIEQWAGFIDSLENVAYADKIHYDYEFKNKIYRAIDTGKRYNTLLLEGKCGRAASVIREYVRKIHEIGLHCEKSKNELPFRKDPFCIAMFGETDIGKSGCITTIGFDIMDSLNYPLHNRWCAINCTEKFFSENYRQQAAVYFDDFSTFTSEEQYQKFFNLKANTAYPLDMAFRKGEYFNSDFIFMTTNTPYPEPNFVTNHSALLRRRDLLVEAAWIDDDDIQNALREKRNMAQFRKLDNTHLKFRLRNSQDPQSTPGAWMTYAELIQECIVEARSHLERQQQKLTNDLTRAGYIVPRAEAGEMRKICKEATRQCPRLMLFDPELWDHLTYDPEEDRFDMYIQHSGPMETEWEKCQEFFEEYEMDVQQALKRCSYVVKPKTPLKSKITTGFAEFKDFISQQIRKVFVAYPWLHDVAKWSILLAAAVGSVACMWLGLKTIGHACACKALIGYGYRCGFCGKWPALKNVREGYKPVLLGLWRDLYGDLPYRDFHITTPAEESALLSVQKARKTEVTEPYIATRRHAESIYSDVTKGAKVTKVTANTGPYQQDVKGAKITKVTANTGPTNFEKETSNIKPAAESQQTEAIVTQRVFPYLYKLRSRGKVGLPSQTVTSYAIGQRYIMTVKHFFHGFDEGDHFEICHNGEWMNIEYVRSRITEIPKKDLLIYDMPIQFHAHKDNTKHFIGEEELCNFQKGTGTLCKLDVALRSVQVDNLKVVAIKELEYEMDINNQTIPIYVQNAWKYQKCSSYGDCGSPLVAYSDRLRGKILGIHVASDSELSYSQLVTRQMLEKLITRKEGTPMPVAEAKFGNLIPKGHLGRIGKAPAGKGFFQGPKTEIIPTAIHGLISKPTTFPSVLTINDPRLEKRVHPLRLGIEKYSFTSTPFPQKHRDIVNEMMREECRMMIRTRDPEPLSWEQACNGIPEIEGYERLPKNTSPGYPWILTRPAGACGKAYLFNEETGLPLFELQKAIEFREQKAKMNERVESVWIDCLKDERRPLEKIKKGSTRVFTIPPVDFSLLMRKYTLDFCVAVKNSRSFMDCKVGMDPQSLEWTTLYYWLAEFSPYCVAGDFSRFDGSMPADLIDDVREDIEYFYSTFGKSSLEDSNVRKILFDELIHTIHLAKDEFYMTHIGNKSGNPITVILNSRINKRYMALAWLGLCEKFQKWDYYSMASFQANVRCAIYGDDNLLSIKQEVIEWYNQETISEYLAEYKIIYTNEEKSGITKFKKLDECAFLKQTFHNHTTINMIKVPHMKQQTILELLNWTRVAPDQDELLFDNCNDALRFAYFYGEKYFNQLREKIIKALETVDKTWLPKTYTDYHLWFLVTIGALQSKKSAEGFLQDLAHSDTPRWKKVLTALTVGPLAWTIVKLRGPVKDDGRLRTERKAVCIPSGEGKTWLCEHYPELFVDHDDVTLPALEKELQNVKSLEKWSAVGNALLNPQHYDTPEDDKRILLTHHPNTTNRTILGKYVLPYPNFNRNNFVNRLLLDKPQKLEREKRNAELISLARRELGIKCDNTCFN